MALYYLLLRGWVVFGHSEIALRSLSVILAVGALWVRDHAGALAVRPPRALCSPVCCWR